MCLQARKVQMELEAAELSRIQENSITPNKTLTGLLMKEDDEDYDTA